jgi:Tfp pilus assembly protein PilW
MNRSFIGIAGYTLLELVAALALTGFMIALLGGMFWSSVRSFEAGDQRTEVQESARTGMAMMVADIKSSRSITTITPHTIVLVSADNSALSFYQSGEVLYRSINSTPNPVCMKVASFDVEEVFPNQVRLRLVTQVHNHSCVLATRVNKMIE